MSKKALFFSNIIGNIMEDDESIIYFENGIKYEEGKIYTILDGDLANEENGIRS